MPELSREEFEKWATTGNFAEVPFLILKDSYGNYIAGETEDLWEAAKFFYAAASGEALRWIPVEEKLPEFEVPAWGLLRMQDSTGYCLAIVMRGDGDDGWLWHICDDWGGPRMISWPYRLEESAQFECDDDYRVKFWLPITSLPAAPYSRTSTEGK